MVWFVVVKKCMAQGRRHVHTREHESRSAASIIACEGTHPAVVRAHDALPQPV